METQIPQLDGVHHLKLPVSDLGRSSQWYHSRLGYGVAMEFREDGKVMGLALHHPDGGPPLALRLDPDKAAASSGFDYFSIGVPTKAAMEALSERLTQLGDAHAGVQLASLGWIRPGLSDPDGHEIRFYTTESHKEAPPGRVYVVDNTRRPAHPNQEPLPPSGWKNPGLSEV